VAFQLGLLASGYQPVPVLLQVPIQGCCALGAQQHLTFPPSVGPRIPARLHVDGKDDDFAYGALNQVGRI